MAFLKKETLENGAVANFWVMTNLKIGSTYEDNLRG